MRLKTALTTSFLTLAPLHGPNLRTSCRAAELA
jgi:hypothetical protein